MFIRTKIKKLKYLLDKSEEIKIESSSDPTFKSWKNLVEITLNDIFGKESIQVENFNCLNFFYRGIMIGGGHYDNDHLEFFRRDFETLKKYIVSYIDEFNQFKHEYCYENIINKIKLFWEKTPKWIKNTLVSILIAFISGILLAVVLNHINL